MQSVPTTNSQYTFSMQWIKRASSGCFCQKEIIVSELGQKCVAEAEDIRSLHSASQIYDSKLLEAAKEN